jgi:hypothetical protein
MGGLKKYLVVGVLLFGIVLVSGCIKTLTFREDIDVTGMSKMTIVFEPMNKTEAGWDKKNPCDNNTINNENITEYTCKFDGKKETISYKFNRMAAGGLTKSGNNTVSTCRILCRHSLKNLASPLQPPCQRLLRRRPRIRRI